MDWAEQIPEDLMAMTLEELFAEQDRDVSSERLKLQQAVWSAQSALDEFDERRHDIARAITKKGGTVLYDLAGNEVPAKLIHGKYGWCWALLGSDGEVTGTFIGAFPKKEQTLTAKGYREGRRKI